MNADAVEQALLDYEALHRDDDDRGLEAVRAAIFLEDVLGVRVTDDDIRGPLAGPTPDLRGVAARATGTT